LRWGGKCCSFQSPSSVVLCSACSLVPARQMPMMTLAACIFAASAASVSSKRALVNSNTGRIALAEPEFIEPVMEALEKALKSGPVWIRDKELVKFCVRLSISGQAESEFVQRIFSALAGILEHQDLDSVDNVAKFLLHNIGKAEPEFVHLAAVAFVKTSRSQDLDVATEAVEDLGRLAQARPKFAGIVVKTIGPFFKYWAPKVAEKAIEVLGSLCKELPELAGQVVLALRPTSGPQALELKAIGALRKLCRVRPELTGLVAQALGPTAEHGQEAVAEKALEVLGKLAEKAPDTVKCAVAQALRRAKAHKSESVRKKADRLLRRMAPT